MANHVLHRQGLRGNTRALLRLALIAAGGVTALFTAVPSAAADRDFLTAEEIDQVREIQEPNARIQLYLKFAQQRARQLDQLIARERTGRSALIHDLLEDYTNIIDALDTVTDDALRKGVDMSKGVGTLVPAEHKLLEQLQKIQDSHPSDLARYEFTLKDAIDSTQGSIDLAADLTHRTRELAGRDKHEAEERKEGLAPVGGVAPSGQPTADAKQGDPNNPPVRKPPTLRRPTDPPPTH